MACRQLETFQLCDRPASAVIEKSMWLDEGTKIVASSGSHHKRLTAPVGLTELRCARAVFVKHD